MTTKRSDAPGPAGPNSPEVPPPETWASMPGLRTLGGERRLVRWWRLMIYGRDPTHVRWLGEKIGTLRVSITESITSRSRIRKRDRR